MSTKTLFLRIARRLMSCPAAPYHEDAVAAEVGAICAEHGLACRADPAGNLLVTLKTASVRPLVLAAHLDHPGFEVLRQAGTRRWAAQFLGGVGPEYFRRGVPVRLMPGNHAGRLAGALDGRKRGVLATSQPIADRPAYAVWDLPAFRVRQGCIHGRACDDLIGVAAALTTLIVLKQRRARVHVIAAISRAEEVGFQGALLLADRRALPRQALVVSLETSREMAPVKMDQGVIIRVGDRASIFDSAATRSLAELATALAKRKRGFRWQRALMSGGTCEATAYQEHGYQTAAVCVALGNYHNCGPRRRIAAEYVSLADALAMTDLLVATGRSMNRLPALGGRLTTRLRKLLAKGRRRLLPAGKRRGSSTIKA